MQLDLVAQDFSERAVSPFHELGAYESLWDEQNASFKSIAALFSKRVGSIPSDFVERAGNLLCERGSRPAKRRGCHKLWRSGAWGRGVPGAPAGCRISC